ncbi:MAG: hypothetical protein IV100_23150 [Myxococcales bacterium]|nr:hypothetical protein [Myxococcales bacterium]
MLDTVFGTIVLLCAAAGLWQLVRLIRSLNTGPGGEAGRVHVRELARLRERRDGLAEDLRTSELDFKLGRVPRQAYEAERARIEPELVLVLAALDKLEPPIEELT